MDNNFTEIGYWIRRMLEENNYGVRDVSVKEMDFFMAVKSPESVRENIEIYKIRNLPRVVCKSTIRLGSKNLEKLNKFSIPQQQSLRKSLEDLRFSQKLSVLDIEDDGNDYTIIISSVAPLDEFSGKIFADCMENLNNGGNAVLEVLDNYFKEKT